MENTLEEPVNDAIKKASLNIFLLSKEIENNKNIKESEAKKIIDSLIKIDKELLKMANIKLSFKQKNDAYSLLKIMNK